MSTDVVIEAQTFITQDGFAEEPQAWLRRQVVPLARTSLTENERLAVALFVTTLCERFPEIVESIILFGSAARGDARWQSDVDLLVLTSVDVDKQTTEAIKAISHESEWCHDAVLSVLIFAPSTQQWHGRGSSFWLNIQTDGIVLYAKAGTQILNRNAWPERFTPESRYQMTDAQYDEIRIHMERTTEDLTAACLMLDSHLERPAIAHCYYAVFHAASALFLTKGIVQARHSGVRSQLGFHFFKSAILPPEWSKLYETLQDERESATYSMDYEPGSEVAEQRLVWAKEFVDTARRHLIEHNFLKETGV